MRSDAYHCCGCDRLIHCEMAFKPGSEKCGMYVRNSYHNCHKCLRFGQDCQRSGLVKCDFLARIAKDPFAKLSQLKKEIED